MALARPVTVLRDKEGSSFKLKILSFLFIVNVCFKAVPGSDSIPQQSFSSSVRDGSITCHNYKYLILNLSIIFMLSFQTTLITYSWKEKIGIRASFQWGDSRFCRWTLNFQDSKRLLAPKVNNFPIRGGCKHWQSVSQSIQSRNPHPGCNISGDPNKASSLIN